MKLTPELSIIITSYRQPEILKLAIESIKSNIGEISYEILSVDGGTQEKTTDLMREEFPEVRFFPHVENVGLEPLINKGLKEARGEFLLVMNADIIFKDDSFRSMLDYLKLHPDVGLLGPKLINFDGTFQQSCFRFYTPWTILYRRTFLGKFSFAKKHLAKFEMKSQLKKEKPIEVDWLMGSILMTSRKVVQKVGFMNLGGFMYMEDVDWCWSMWKNGYKVIYYPFAKVYHYHGKQSGNKGFLGVTSSLLFNRYTRHHTVSAFKFFKKHWREKNPRESFYQNKN
ncbi:MAG TPA: glycosyltransferase family 2 protein [Candidatus Moranbacteria bacterium]|nr:glycosyltransferase family 2 protein [Candidatus Moranbacteria bacterium]